jgi:hypothetical protein
MRLAFPSVGAWLILVASALAQGRGIGGTSKWTAAGPPSAGDPTTTVLPIYNDVYANWSVAGLTKIGGVPARTQCGSTLTPIGGGADDATKIQNAVNSCRAGQFLLLSGAFSVTMSDSIMIQKGITVRGLGRCANGSTPYCATSITVTNGQLPTYAPGGQCGTDTSHIVSCVQNSVFYVGPNGRFNQRWSGCAQGTNATGCSTAFDTSAAQGATTIQVHTQAHLSVGMWVRLDEASGATTQTDPSNASGTVFAATDFTASSGSPATGKIAYAGATVEDGQGYGALYDRETSEIHLITALGSGPCPEAGCTVTFDSPLTIAFRAGAPHFAQIYWPTNASSTAEAFVQQAGIENLSILRGTGGPIYMAFCAYCWVKNVETSGWTTGFIMSNDARLEVTNNYFHDCYDCENNGAEYPIAIDGATTESLISNNIIRLAGKGMVGRSCGGGNVVSYNYQDDTFYMATVLGNSGSTWA